MSVTVPAYAWRPSFMRTTFMRTTCPACSRRLTLRVRDLGERIVRCRCLFVFVTRAAS